MPTQKHIVYDPNGQVISETNTVTPDVPKVLTKSEAQDHMAVSLGAGSSGRTRFGKVMKSVRASNDDEVSGFLVEKWDGVTECRKNETSTWLLLLVSKGTAAVTPAFTQAEHDAIINGWPNG